MPPGGLHVTMDGQTTAWDALPARGIRPAATRERSIRPDRRVGLARNRSLRLARGAGDPIRALSGGTRTTLQHGGGGAKSRRDRSGDIRPWFFRNLS
jgi:hypothetical protein